MQKASERLKSARDEMHRLHAIFLESLKYRQERSEGHPINPTQWFMMLTQNPSFDWLRPFTQLLTEVDILLDEKVITEDQVLTISKKLNSLFTPGNPDNIFGTRFFEMMPQEPDIMVHFPRFREAKNHLAPPQD